MLQGPECTNETVSPFLTTPRLKAPKIQGIWLSLWAAKREPIVVGLCGGEGGIRTPDRLTPMSDFESGAFNRALPPLRIIHHFSTGPDYFKCAVTMCCRYQAERRDRTSRTVLNL